MIKKLIILLLFFPFALFAQFTDDFETGNISNWTQSNSGRWDASTTSPLNGTYSLYHIFDNPDADHDQVSVELPTIDLSADTTIWRFRIKYDYNPSDGNNWSIFIVSDIDANQMTPTGTVNGYVLGVNYTGSDDTLRLLKISSGSATEVITTSLNWDLDTDPSDIIALEIGRSSTGEWEIYFAADGDFNNLLSIGTGSDNTYTIADYFGVYYDYTSSADRNLWIDDIYIGEEILDTILPTIDSLYVLSAKKLRIDYSEKVDSLIGVNPLNYFINGGVANPDSVIIDESHKYAELYFSPKFNDNQSYDITIQNVEDAESNSIKDTTLNFSFEYIKALGVEVISSNEIVVQFSSRVDTISSENINNYSLDNGLGNPILAEVSTNDSTKVQLQFGSNFTNKTYYNLTIQDIADQNQDSLQTEIVSFLYFVPEAFDIVINEIFADPYPAVDLPEFEYIEIKNTTEFDIDLTGWKLKVGTTEKDFPDYILDSASYVILCSSAAGEYFEVYGNVLEFSSISITNTGVAIGIYDDNNVLIDSVNFTDEWYSDPEKDDGGWSLEKIDPLNNCSGITNWKASENANGGTPGTGNSIFAANIDTESPVVEEIKIISNNQLKLIFNEPLNQSTALETLNYSVSNGIGNPLSIIISANAMEIELLFSSSFIDGENAILSIENIEDLCGNTISTINLEFLYYNVQSYDIVINEIFADPNPAVDLPEFEYLEIKNITEFDIDLSGWKLKVGTTVKNFPDYILDSAAYITLCSSTAGEFLSIYGDVLEFSSFPLISNSGTAIAILNDNNVLIDSVNFTDEWYSDPDKSDGGWSLEKIDPSNNCSGITNWKASEDANGGTPGTENSVFASNIDIEAPIVEEIKIISSKELKLTFNEPLNQSTALEILNYSVSNGIVNPSFIIISTNAKEVELLFSSSFIDGENAILSIDNIEDLCGNTISTINLDFIYYNVQSFDIVINEIFADSDPVVSLPDFEYIEIYNTTKFDIDLSGWKLKVGTTLKDFPDYILDSAAYVTLCSVAAGEFLSVYGNVLEFSSFPLISNSGTSIVIIDENNILIDTVNYTDEWYADEEKEDGGWSLEKIDPLNNCSGITNWKASENANGGTPGTENSVFASNIDTEAPRVELIEILSNNQIKVIFNEAIIKTTLENRLSFTVNNGIGNPFSLLLAEDLTEVDLLFLNSFTEGDNLTLAIANLIDNCGNPIVSTEIDFTYHVVLANDIVINEIMADPEPAIGLPEFEYIEIHNTTDYDISLTNWTITVGSSVKTLSSRVIEAHDFLILCSEFASIELQAFGNVLAFSSFPSLANSEQTLTLRNSNNEIISTVSYSDEWYNDEYKAEGGWSLEQIDPLNPCGGENNWIASESITGGTPGQINSVQASNPDIDAPELLRISVINNDSIQLFFNESIDSISAMKFEIYSVDQNIGNPNSIDLIGVDYKSLILGFEDEFVENTLYILEISGEIVDCAGNEISDRNTDQFSIPAPVDENDLVINEILFNPLPDAYDFIEIYNRSDKTIDLQELYVATYDMDEGGFKSVEQIIEEGYLLFPKSFVVLSEDPEIVKQQYYSSNTDAFIKIKSLPSLNDDEGLIYLLDKWENVIDFMRYLESMQFPLLATAEGVSLERINYERPSEDKTNWHSASEIVGFATPAYENSQFKEQEDIKDEVNIEPKVFSPDNDGFDDFANISFTFDEPGYVANIKIFDSRGRLIRYLANNQLLGIDGVITWDGLDENNQKSPVGIYVVFIEIFDLDGNVKQFKKSVVVAQRF